ncbi:MAG: TRAP transporter small permease [Candidatus Accumulibacter sp.]|jgi:TRAP-type C4-dicarboxylate transport system permease small subunit|nr:TRAP transporter small permease [Accumulibacter sp.]
MTGFLRILYDRIVFTLVWIIGVVMSLCILLQIFGRTFSAVPFAWTDELARFSLIWFCFLGGAMTLRNKLHLGIDYFESKMPERVKFANRIFVYGLIIAFGLFLGVLGTQLLGIVGAQLTPVMRIPMACVYFAIPLAGVLYAILGAWQLYCHVTGKPYTTTVQEVSEDVLKGAAGALGGEK